MRWVERGKKEIYTERKEERERERERQRCSSLILFLTAVFCCQIKECLVHILHANYVQSVSLFIKVAAEFPENYIRKWSRCVRVQMSEQKTIICNKLSRIVRLTDHTLNSVNGYNVSRLSPVLESHFVYFLCLVFYSKSSPAIFYVR